MKNERTERMISTLDDEWESVIVLCTRHTGHGTEMFRYMTGNALANQKMLENMLDDVMFTGGNSGDEEEESWL